MVDVAETNGHEINAGKLAAELGVPVCPVVASSSRGLPSCGNRLFPRWTAQANEVAPRQFYKLPAAFAKEATALRNCWRSISMSAARRRRPRRC